MRKGLLPHLARLMKDKLFHGVASQRMHLLQTQQAGARQVTELEQRLAKIQSQWQNRLAAYERRIAELEKEITTRDQVNRELLAGNRQIKEAMAKPQEPVGS
jgi:chromosome segregation ATPase